MYCLENKNESINVLYLLNYFSLERIFLKMPKKVHTKGISFVNEFLILRAFKIGASYKIVKYQIYSILKGILKCLSQEN